MKITHVATHTVSLPTDNPLVVGLPPRNDKREFVTLELGTDQGAVGIGVTFFGGALTPALHSAVDTLARLCIGDDPQDVEPIAAKLRSAAGSSGPGGIFTLAMSAVDIACWDLIGKAAGRSVAALLGGRQRVPCYASGIGLRGFSHDVLAKTGQHLVEAGFRQMKMQCGSEPTVSSSVERVKVMREAIGPDVDLMCDINQLWRVDQAISIGRRIEDVGGLFWLEDPTTHDDYAGLARIADNLTMPVAAGEYCYGISSFRHLLEHRSVDVVMVDTLRAGGFTQWLKIAGMAEAFNLPIVSHLMPEINLHMVAAAPNGLTVEYMPWTRELYQETPAIERGELVVPTTPGLGLAFDQAALKKYQVA
ncbi:MAG TPA: mandelate racemase/muconate lactonizing enzyme family protein [Chloroflexota bacterium]|nr:mandelate racemase/muconate lactonizing enzyme family protein [Chloroflexota bacterium]